MSHRHTDHFGDLDAFIVGSWLSGRYTPLHVYGAFGETPELGTKAAVARALAWDIKSRTGLMFGGDTRPNKSFIEYARSADVARRGLEGLYPAAAAQGVGNRAWAEGSKLSLTRDLYCDRGLFLTLPGRTAQRPRREVPAGNQRRPHSILI